MAVLLTGRDSYAQFIAVLAVFVLVLGVTALVTRWIAGYQKQMNANVNVEVIETIRIATNKYIQIVRLGQTYLAIAVCRDTVTRLCEIPAEQLKQGRSAQGSLFSAASFKELLEKAAKKNAGGSDGAGDSQSDEEDQSDN